MTNDIKANMLMLCGLGTLQCNASLGKDLWISWIRLYGSANMLMLCGLGTLQCNASLGKDLWISWIRLYGSAQPFALGVY
jgi:hypothetical protein